MSICGSPLFPSKKMKTLFAFLCLICVVFSCRGGVAYEFYRSGNANGIPVLSMDDKKKGSIYFNGNCNGIPSWTVERRGNISYLYDLKKSGAIPAIAIRFKGDMAEFHPTGNCGGFPEKSLKFHASGMAFYPNGNCNGVSTMFLRKKGQVIEIYRSGNGNGAPSYSLKGPWDEQKIAELFFVLLTLGYLSD